MSLYGHKFKRPSEMITMKLTILDLDSREDYNRIAGALMEIEGVEEVGPYWDKKISVTYNSEQVGLEHIVYKISIMGYRYVNRF